MPHLDVFDMSLSRVLLFAILVVASIGPSGSSNDDDARPSHPWVFDCAKTGLINSQLPPPSSRLENLLSCMVDQSLTDRFTEDDLNFRDKELDWCLPPSFLDRSCLSSGFDPRQYFITCLFESPILGSFLFENETGNSESFADDKVVVEEALIDGLCELINGLRSPQGVGCLVEMCQTVSESPSRVPSDTPSFNPTNMPSMEPSNTSSESPSFQASDQPTFSSMDDRTSDPSSEVPQGKKPSFRYPPLVVRIEILLKFILRDVPSNMSSAHELNDGFVDVLTVGVNNILITKVEGHELVEILLVDTIPGTNDLSVLLRAAAIRECLDCSASELSEQIVNQYLSALRSASYSGSLANQIEFHGFVSDLPPLSNITVDPSSVESLVVTNQNDKLQAEAKLSGSVENYHSILIFTVAMLMTVAIVM